MTDLMQMFLLGACLGFLVALPIGLGLGLWGAPRR